MFRILIPALTVFALAAPGFAHEGFHFHPHGVQFGWLATAVVGGVGVLALMRFRGPK